MVDSHATIERGGAVQCASLATALAARGHHVTCFFEGAPGGSPPGAAFKRLMGAAVDLRFARQRSPTSMRRFRRALHDKGPDLIHTHKNRALRFVYGATLGMKRLPWVANRGTVYSLYRDWSAARIHLRCVDRLLAVSHAVREVLLRDGMPPERVEVVYGSVDPKRFDPDVSGEAFRERWEIAPGVPLIGMLASLATPKKGHVDLLVASSLLRERFPALRVVFAGEGDPSILRTKARDLGIADRVVFAGFVEEAPEFLAAVDLLVCASVRGEGLTGAVREALAMECPVVSTDCAGNSEMVIDGKTGLLTPPSDPPLLAEAIASLLEDRKRARALARAGRKRVLEYCSDEVRARHVERIYRELLAERGSWNSVSKETGQGNHSAGSPLPALMDQHRSL